jgi:hypothetical protein
MYASRSKPLRNRAFRGREKIASRPVSRVLYGPDASRRRNVAAIHLGYALLRTSCNLPGRRAGNCPESRLSYRPYSVLLPVWFTVPLPLPGTRWALTPPFHPCRRGPRAKAGGLLSVALSLGSPPPDVIRHRVSMEPGLSSPAAFRLSRVRPPGRLALRIKVFARQNATPPAAKP